MIGKFCLAALCLTAALLFYGCAPTVTVNGETFEALTPREEKDLVLIARAALKRSPKAVGRNFGRLRIPNLRWRSIITATGPAMRRSHGLYRTTAAPSSSGGSC